MRMMKTIGNWGAAAMLAALCLVPSSAFAADECQVDSDCGENFVCSFSTAPCPAMPPCDRADGESCPEPPACEPETVGYCQPAPPRSCETVADCEQGLVCVTYTYETCSGGDAPSCAPDSEGCPEPSEPSDPQCSTESEGYCLPPYLAPCEAAADCGEGFACKAQEICTCSGGRGVDLDSPEPGGVEGSGGEDSGDVPADDCTCEPGDVKYCELIQQECDSDADCAGDLICAEVPGANVPAPDDTCTSGPDGVTICEAAPSEDSDVPADSYCLPADFERWIGGGYPGGAQEDSAAHDSDPRLPGSGEADFDDGSRDIVGAEVDRGGAATGSDEDSGCGCASTQDSLPGSFAALLFALLGMAGLRRRA